MDIPEIPFTILALAPFRPVADSSFSPEVLRVATGSMDEAIAALAPQIWIPQPAEICPEGGITVSPARMKDLTPDGLIRVPYLKNLHDASLFIEKAIASGEGPGEIAGHLKAAWPGLPLDLTVPAPEARLRQQNVVDDILSMVAMPGQPAPGAASGPKAWKNRIDNVLADLLENVYADEAFRIFEAAWRGVEAIVRQGPVREDSPVRLLIFPVSPADLAESLETLVSELAPEPPSLVLIDIPFDSSPGSIELMGKAAIFAETLLAPVAGWITPAFFHMKSWKDLKKLPYLRNYLEGAAYAKWRKLREREESRWLVLTCNRFLARPPYGKDFRPRTVFFREKDQPWVSPVWALGALAAQSAELYGWPSRFTDYVNIQLRDLAVDVSDEGPAASTEAVLSSERLRQFEETGIMPLTGAAKKDIAFMPGDTTASGESLLAQLFFSCVIGFLMRCCDQSYGKSKGGDGQTSVADALSGFFRQNGCEPPPDLVVEAGQAEEGKPVPLHISFTPPVAALPGAQRMEFTFLW